MGTVETIVFALLAYTVFLSAAFTASLVADHLLEKRHRFQAAMMGGVFGVASWAWILLEHLECYLAWVGHFARYLGAVPGALVTNMLIGSVAGMITVIMVKFSESVRNRQQLPR